MGNVPLVCKKLIIKMANSRLFKINLDYQDLLDKLDSKIYDISKKAFDNRRFNLGLNINYELYEDLYDYRNILNRRYRGCNCIEGVPLEELSYKINQLSNINC